MFQAKQVGDHQLAETLMIQMEDERTKLFAKPSRDEVNSLLPSLPEFCRNVLGRSQSELQILEPSNCINAALNFHAPSPRWESYSTMELLDRLQTQFEQIQMKLEEGRFQYQFGDLVVLWSRNGGSWDNRQICVDEINSHHPEFPYGLVFDHIFVCVSSDLAFHKADPTSQSRYEIDYIPSIIAPARTNQGFEMTLHRRH